MYFLEDFIFPVLISVLVLTLVFAIIGIPIAGWISSSMQAKMWNEKYGTNYTTKDFFFAGETIKNYFGSGENKTININGLNK